MNKFIASLSIVLIFASCENKTGTGAVAGAGLGATAGAIISGTGEGALIGGAIGAAGGALIGASLDDNDRQNMQQQSPRTLNKIDNGEQLSTDDIKKMAKAGLSDNVIISQIQATHSVFYLSTADIIDLKNAGVSQRVIDTMIQTGNS
jgi:outer membrane lipoprotein SlyB